MMADPFSRSVTNPIQTEVLLVGSHGIREHAFSQRGEYLLSQCTFTTARTWRETCMSTYTSHERCKGRPSVATCCHDNQQSRSSPCASGRVHFGERMINHQMHPTATQTFAVKSSEQLASKLPLGSHLIAFTSFVCPATTTVIKCPAKHVREDKSFTGFVSRLDAGARPASVGARPACI